jgi:hypothetical protein
MYQRLFLYVSIAVLTCIASETSQSILPIYYAIGLKATLQALIAWRAYIDQTPAQCNLKQLSSQNIE